MVLAARGERTRHRWHLGAEPPVRRGALGSRRRGSAVRSGMARASARAADPRRRCALRRPARRLRREPRHLAEPAHADRAGARAGAVGTVGVGRGDRRRDARPARRRGAPGGRGTAVAADDAVAAGIRDGTGAARGAVRPAREDGPADGAVGSRRVGFRRAACRSVARRADRRAAVGRIVDVAGCSRPAAGGAIGTAGSGGGCRVGGRGGAAGQLRRRPAPRHQLCAVIERTDAR